MQKHDPIHEVENALLRLAPTALSQTATEEIESVIDDLSGQNSSSLKSSYNGKVALGLVAAVALGVFLSLKTIQPKQQLASDPQASVQEMLPAMSFLSEANRVEKVSDQGIYTDAGGSAVRQVRVRVVEETSLRDEETGIVVKLSEPREEVHLVPVSTF